MLQSHIDRGVFTARQCLLGGCVTKSMRPFLYGAALQVPPEFPPTDRTDNSLFLLNNTQVIRIIDCVYAKLCRATFRML